MPKNTLRRWGIVRFVRIHTRLVLSFVAGLVLLPLLPAGFRLETRILLAWDLVAALYVGSTFWMISKSTIETCRHRAALYDEGDWGILLVVIVSASASFGAIFAELAVLKGPHASLLYALLISGGTVALSWTFTHVMFTLHYANIYYRPAKGGAGGLKFPGDRPPDYHDFLYYAFVIGCAAQTADVETISPAMRRLTLAHGIVSFAFNTAILALIINVGASVLS